MEKTIAGPGSSNTVQNGHRPKGAPTVESWVPELQAWKLSLEHAERANRNLLQDAAGIAALLGIQAGSGGVFALAQAVTVAKDGATTFVPDDIMRVLLIAAAVGAALSLGLAVLLVRAFWARHRAEADADEHLAKLIEAKPDHFLPSAT